MCEIDCYIYHLLLIRHTASLAAELEASQQENARLKCLSAELDICKAENTGLKAVAAEVTALRTENARLQTLAVDIEASKAENLRLQAGRLVQYMERSALIADFHCRVT